MLSSVDLLVDVGRDDADDGLRQRVGRLLALRAAAASTVISTRGDVLALAGADDRGRGDLAAQLAEREAAGARGRRSAASERMTWLTVFGFVARLWIWPPPEVVNGWPR